MPTPLVQATGRRKRAVARVRIREGSGAITINKRPLEDYFPNPTHRMILTEPLKVSETDERYDIDATIHGGGITGQAGALRLGIARGLIALDTELRAPLKRGRLPHPRRPREGIEEVRPEEGPQGTAVLEALNPMRFGTDGVRGVANAELTPEFALALGRAAARVLGGDHFLIGRDTRRSGPMLEAALAAGLCAEGRTVELLGVLPDPGRRVPVRARRGRRGGDLGVAQPLRRQRHQAVRARRPQAARRRPGRDRGRARRRRRRTRANDGGAVTGSAVGSVSHVEGRATERYEEAVLAALEGRRLDGLRVVLDCANGAASEVAPEVFGRTGATVSVIHAEPDGRNINDGCGSTHPDVVGAVVRRARRRRRLRVRRRRRSGHRGRPRRPGASTATSSSPSPRSTCAPAARCAATPSS